MNTTMRAMLIASLALAFTACKKEEAAPVDEAKQALVAPSKDDDAGWKKYLQEVAIQNMGNITTRPFLYYLSPESDPDFQAKYERQQILEHHLNAKRQAHPHLSCGFEDQ